MKKLLVLAMAALIGCTATMAQDNNNNNNNRQGRGNFDPAAMQQRMMDNVKERLEINDETEWKAVQPLVEKVMTAQRQAMGDRMRGMMGGRRGGPGGGPGGDNAQGGNRGGMFGGQSNPDADALQRAIDGKASSSELKSALNKYIESRKTRQADLEKAQADLRKVLTPRQEAIATLSGLL